MVRKIRRYQTDIPLIVSHVPKCGGTSVAMVFRGWYEDKFFEHYVDRTSSILPKKHDVGSDSCIYGHFNRGEGVGIDHYYPENRQCVMFLRHPLQATISLYFYKKQTSGVVPDDINEFIENYWCWFPLYMPIMPNLGNYDVIFDEYFLFVGTLENASSDLDTLAKILGRHFHGLPHHNATQRSQGVSADVARVHKDRNPLAYAMYEYALSNT
jgi:hypothetical protein